MLRHLSSPLPTKADVKRRMLWALASGKVVESNKAKPRVFNLIGQVLYFRICARLVSRRMGWHDIGPAEIEEITKQLLRNLDAVLATKEA